MINDACSSDTSLTCLHGSIPASQQPSAFQTFPIPADVALIEQRVGDRPGLIVGAQPGQKPGGVEGRGEDVGTQRGKPLIEPGPALGDELEPRPVELDYLGISASQHDPGASL